MKYFEHIDAYSVEEAAEAMAAGARAIAGGTDLLGTLKDKILPEYPKTIVNLKTIEGLSYITKTEKGLSIGANTKLCDIAESQLVKEKAPSLSEAVHSVASPLIRNQATLGGNLCQDVRCWYYRYPNQIGGRMECVRKGGEGCKAFTGEHRYHSIFGSMRVHASSCTQSCPAGVQIPAYLSKVRAGDIKGAAEILLQNNPLCAITGRVCTHFCQMGCYRKEYDENVSIGQIERFVGDYILKNSTEMMPPPEHETGKKVAIVGAGPAGLSAAYYLRRAGHTVILYDKMDEPGGVLMYAMPEYRLPKEKVREMVRALKGMGIEFKQNVHIGEDATLDEIYRSHDSVFLDTGAWKRNIIGIDGEELTRFGLEFLTEVKSWMKDKPGQTVVVVGGGNVAVDVARTAKRLGAPSVSMVSLETRETMPATDEEMERALAEDIVHIGGWGPSRVLREDGKITGMEFRRCVSLRDENGNFAPSYDENDKMTVPADAILLAVGQQIDLSFLDERLGIETSGGRVAVEASQMTNRPGVFAGGDLTTGPATVVSAVATGRRGALSIDEYLTGNKREGKTLPEGGFLTQAVNCLEHSAPIPPNMRPVTERAVDIEDDLGLSFEEVQREASRCFNCGCFASNPSDSATVLVCLNATVTTNKKTYTAEEFFQRTPRIQDILDPDEILISVEIPDVEGIMAYDKFRERASIDFSVVSVASRFDLKDGKIKEASIVLGAVAPVPVRAIEAEEYLCGKPVTEEVAEQAAELALQKAKPLEQNRYKVQIAKTLIKRCIMNTLK